MFRIIKIKLIVKIYENDDEAEIADHKEHDNHNNNDEDNKDNNDNQIKTNKIKSNQIIK